MNSPKQDYPVTRKVISRDEAIHYFRKLGEEYKAKIIEDIPANETLIDLSARRF